MPPPSKAIVMLVDGLWQLSYLSNYAISNRPIAAVGSQLFLLLSFVRQCPNLIRAGEFHLKNEAYPIRALYKKNKACRAWPYLLGPKNSTQALETEPGPWRLSPGSFTSRKGLDFIGAASCIYKRSFLSFVESSLPFLDYCSGCIDVWCTGMAKGSLPS